MNKKLKEALIKKHNENKELFPSLYEQRWVEKAATDGWNELVKNLEKLSPKLAEETKVKGGYNLIAVIYYSSFENALNTFFHQAIEDGMTTVELSLDELQKLTAEIKEIIKE